MDKNELIYKCHVNTNETNDTFVGIKCEDNIIKVCFPLGYHLGESESEQKKDIYLLIRILSRFACVEENLLPNKYSSNTYETKKFPIHAYLRVLDEYYSRGYYTENEVFYSQNSKGSINWAKTIRTQKAYPQDGSLIYLNTISRKTKVNSANLITRINEFCVEESYKKIGWIFTPVKPKRASIDFQEKLFLTELQAKLSQSNNDRNKVLFSSMIDIIRYLNTESENSQLFFGTNKFEYVWEKLIDFNFGIQNKGYYFPRTLWNLKNNATYAKSVLEPDTVMLFNNKVYMLDAKYYKYGVSNNPIDLPGSTSINKQITYGEYVATAKKFKDKNGTSPKVYNVFLMPFDRLNSKFKSENNMVHIGEALGDWKTSGLEYERVQGILLDVKWMMTRTIRQNKKDITSLAQLVESVISNINKGYINH